MKATNESDVRRAIVGEFLKKSRQEAGLTQWDVARELGYSTAQFVSNWERGMSLPPLETLPRIASIMSVPGRALIDLMQTYQEEVMKLQRRQMQKLFQGKR